MLEFVELNQKIEIEIKCPAADIYAEVMVDWLAMDSWCCRMEEAEFQLDQKQRRMKREFEEGLHLECLSKQSASCGIVCHSQSSQVQADWQSPVSQLI